MTVCIKIFWVAVVWHQFLCRCNPRLTRKHKQDSFLITRFSAFCQPMRVSSGEQGSTRSYDNGKTHKS